MQLLDKAKKKLRDFLATNYLVREFKIIFTRRLKSFLIKALFVTIFIITFVFAALAVFKPDQLKKIYESSSQRLINYLNPDYSEFSKINISGNQKVTSEQILEVVKATQSRIKNKADRDQELIKSLIDDIKSNLPWVSKVTIIRNIPDILNISITEFEPFVIWQNGGKKYFVDKNGNIIPFQEGQGYDEMVILSGANANMHARSLFNIFAIDPELSATAYSATWIGNRRWDVRFENGLLVKLPETNISKAWQKLIQIYSMEGSTIGLEMIDLRLEDRVYLKYEDGVNKELMGVR
jgi:cell division protein FtsQ